MDTRLYQSSLDEKVEKAESVIQESFDRYGRNKLAVSWTGGKDSMVLLHLARRVIPEPFDLSVFFIDTGLHFEELYQFVEEWGDKWDLNLVRVHPERTIAEYQRETDEERKKELSRTMKIEAIDQGLKDNGWEALMVGIRWDEHEARVDEEFFSKRPSHMRVHPILQFSEDDIWTYIRRFEVPYVSLYDEGYRSLGAKPYTKPTTHDAAERSGREQDKERLMNKLRDLGYF